MKALDRWLQAWRIGKASPYIANGARVLDVGCADGALFEQFQGRIGEGLGVDPDLEAPVDGKGYHLIPGTFPDSLGDERPFDVITMLAVVEHLPPEEQRKIATSCAQYLRPGGYLVITTPSAIVDWILHVLMALHLIDGMSLDQHYGFDPGDTPAVFGGNGLTLVTAKKFQLGLNNLFVFRKNTEPTRSGSELAS